MKTFIIFMKLMIPTFIVLVISGSFGYLLGRIIGRRH